MHTRDSRRLASLRRRGLARRDAVGRSDAAPDRPGIDGSFMSADVKIVRVLLANGRVAEFPLEDVSSVEFSARTAGPTAGARSGEGAEAGDPAEQVRRSPPR